jgi:hypothetical protein
MVAIHLNANYIFVEPMKNRTEGEMTRVYQKIINRMKAAGLGLKKHVLNNKCLAGMKACIKENHMDYEDVPQDNTGKTRQSRLFKHSKATSSPSWPTLTTNSPYRFGATYSSQQNSP